MGLPTTPGQNNIAFLVLFINLLYILLHSFKILCNSLDGDVHLKEEKE